jgi:hypothetical protein
MLKRNFKRRLKGLKCCREDLVVQEDYYWALTTFRLQLYNNLKNSRDFIGRKPWSILRGQTHGIRD